MSYEDLCRVQCPLVLERMTSSASHRSYPNLVYIGKRILPGGHTHYRPLVKLTRFSSNIYPGLKKWVINKWTGYRHFRLHHSECRQTDESQTFFLSYCKTSRRRQIHLRCKNKQIQVKYCFYRNTQVQHYKQYFNPTVTKTNLPL